jgi:hypothetical protein
MRKVLILAVLVAASLPVLAQTLTIDNSYYDWQDIPAMATFSGHYNPFYFSRESGGDRQTLGIDRSLYWSRGGSQLREIKGVLADGNLYLSLSSHSPFAEELSVFAYVYDRRETGEPNSYTLELLPARLDGLGFVALWGADGKPRQIGELVSSSISLECRIPMQELPAGLAEGDVTGLSIDLTTCYHEASSGTYEEFFFTTIYFEDILTPADL